MPSPPDVNIFTRYLLENPWPLGIGLVLASCWLIWVGTRDGVIKNVGIGLVLAACGAIILVIGWFVVTSGEHARIVTRSLVNAVAADDTVLARAQLSDRAALAIGSPRNPGFSRTYIDDLLTRVSQRYDIASNTITMLRGYTESSDVGVVHMACFTQVAESPYPTMSQWVVRVQRESDGSWKIVHLTCVSVNDQTPPIGENW